MTSILARIFDKVVCKECLNQILVNDLSMNKLQNQYAFHPTASCECCLIALLDKLTEMLSDDSNEFVLLISLDISKAFDAIKHSCVFQALKNFTIPESLYKWIISYLTGRKHCTRFKNVISPVATFNAGVIQESGLGPILFILSVADYNVIDNHNSYFMYADDCYLLIPMNNIVISC